MQITHCGCQVDATGDFILKPCGEHGKLSLDGYDEWADGLEEALPWWEVVDRAYEREMDRRMAQAKDWLREEGHVAGPGERDPAAEAPSAA